MMPRKQPRATKNDSGSVIAAIRIHPKKFSMVVLRECFRLFYCAPPVAAAKICPVSGVASSYSSTASPTETISNNCSTSWLRMRMQPCGAPAELDRVAILNHTASGRASVLDLEGAGGSIKISADSFRFAIGRELGWNTLRSDLYQIRAGNGRILFDGHGSGHGVGLCQSGAEQMGAEGRPYREILAFYYPGTVAGVTAKGLSWQRLSSDSITLLTTQPGADRAVLAAAERIEQRLGERTRWPLPQKLELRVYPDLDTFRNATGEPGWVAANNDGRIIHLQPAEVLRAKGTLEATLGHELAHVFVASQIGRWTLPLWFQEGLAGYLQGGAGTGAARIPADTDLRQTADPARARRAYAEAQAEVGALVQRYGETAVLGWVKLGLPAQVANASSSQPPAKSK